MKFLKKLFGSTKESSLYPSLDQREREAIVDLLLMAIYIDNFLSLSETEELKSTADLLGWESETDFSVYIDDAITRVRNVRSNEESLAEFIKYVATRLVSPGSRERALELLNRLLRSDGKSEAEKTFFNKVESSFEANP